MPPVDSLREKIAAARLSLISNVFLTTLKFGVGVLTGSVSVISEGAHSLTDVLASSLSLYTVRKSDQPPDPKHPYGHGKIENLSALIQGGVLFSVGAYIVFEAIQHSVRHEAPQRLDLGLAVMLVSAVTNGFIVRRITKAAKNTNSPSLHATAQDHRADIYTAIGVFTGLILVRLTGNPLFDPIFAVLVALVIFHGAFEVAREAIQNLLDRQLPEAELQTIRSIFDCEPQVLAYHKLRTRQAGSVRYIDAHVLMEDTLTLLHSHEIAEALEKEIREAFPRSIVILHTEPFHAERRHQLDDHGGAPSDEVTKGPGSPNQ